ncbi:hypothetical protein EJB05_13574, partial [Eragrostis curvula]
MEKATKWDRVYANHLEDIFLDHIHHHPQRSYSKTPHSMVAMLESELATARARIAELEDERRATGKRLDRFLRKLEDEKATWKRRARRAVTAAREELRLERRHRRALAAANAGLARDLADARRARELMEEACSELTREVEADQAEVEMLRRECLRLREEMEEERRMLQMAEVWREERVQMKLSDARLALEGKYAQLHRLQAEMEAFLLRGRDKADKDYSSAMREARAVVVDGDDAAASLVRSSPRCHDNGNDGDDGCSRQEEKVDVDAVFEHFRRREKEKARESGAAKPNGVAAAGRYSTASSASNLESVSPATDLFLAKADDDGDDPYSDESPAVDDDPCSWVGTSEPSVSVSRQSNASFSNNNGGGSGVTENHSSTGAGSRRSGAKNTALIRRLWRSAITESRKRTGPAARSGGGTQANGGGWSPLSDTRRSSVAAAAAEQYSSSGSVNQQRKQGTLPQRRGAQHYKQSLKEKLMEARMDDQREKPHSNQIQ